MGNTNNNFRVNALNNFKFLLVIFVLVLLISPALAMLSSGNVKIFAVTEDKKGMAAELYMTTIPGTGKLAFYTSSSLVGKDTQTTGNIAIKIAQKVSGQSITGKDVIFDIKANASEVDGPSAGAAMALLSYSLLAERPLSNEIAITGTITDDGLIGVVGGVGPKAQAASKVGVKLFMIPVGEAVTDLMDDSNFETVNMLEYGPRKLGMKVVEVADINTAIDYAYRNIDTIKVDSTASAQVFIPNSISYDNSLTPMKTISQNYINDAKKTVADAKKALEESTLPELILGDYYQSYSSANRGVEMAQRFHDQNYLYSAANYAFNSGVLAGTIKEIAQNPLLLVNDSPLLQTKITALRKEIESIKQKFNYIPLDSFEWVIGAQQRLAYAENALLKIENTELITINSPNATTTQKQKLDEAIMYEKVYDYVSAESWASVAKDFLKQAQKSKQKMIPVYTNEFRKMVSDEIAKADALILDVNSPKGAIAEATRRLDSAKYSFDNNFIFAALYDAYFSQSFVESEIKRQNMEANALYTLVENNVTGGTTSDSIWANMFFDHAKFYYENAVFNKKLGQKNEINSSIKTSFDLLYLSEKLDRAKNIVEEYLAFTEMNSYVDASAVDDTKPVVEIKYTQKPTDNSLYLKVIFILLALLLVVVIAMGVVIKSKEKSNLSFSGGTRREKLKIVLNNLEKALSQKKISDGEYFFMKKQYEKELQHKNVVGEQRKRLNLSIDDLKIKQRALERGLIDLRRHHKEGLILTDDFNKNYKQAQHEIKDIREEIKLSHRERTVQKREKLSVSNFFKKIAITESKLKGTEELAFDEDISESKEKIKRRKTLRKFAYKNKQKK